MVQLPWMGIGAATAAFALFAALLWWFVPKLQMRCITASDPKDRADIEDNFRKTVGQALGGIAVLIGAGMAYLEFTQQQETAAKQALQQQVTAAKQILEQHQESEKSLKTSQDLLISNQVAKGFEQLASDKIAMRLGGIYALEGVMNTSEQYHQPVLEALCAFVRDGTIGVTINDKGPRTDIQAALSVVGRRKPWAGSVDLPKGPGTRSVDLAGANIPGARLSLASLTYADLEGANLSGANLFKANLSRAVLTGAHLSGAYLEAADLSGAFLNYGADLSGAVLAEANLSDATLFKANLTNANLTGAHNLTQAQLDGACGKPRALPPGLTLDKLKPCAPRTVALPLNPK
jgi:hypothetical protein